MADNVQFEPCRASLFPIPCLRPIWMRLCRPASIRTLVEACPLRCLLGSLLQWGAAISVSTC